MYLIDSRHLLLGGGCHGGGVSEFPIPLIELDLVLGLHASTHTGEGMGDGKWDGMRGWGWDGMVERGSGG